jgi:hypothetical protein
MSNNNNYNNNIPKSVKDLLNIKDVFNKAFNEVLEDDKKKYTLTKDEYKTFENEYNNKIKEEYFTVGNNNNYDINIINNIKENLNDLKDDIDKKINNNFPIKFDNSKTKLGFYNHNLYEPYKKFNKNLLDYIDEYFKKNYSTELKTFEKPGEKSYIWYYKNTNNDIIFIIDIDIGKYYEVILNSTNLPEIKINKNQNKTIQRIKDKSENSNSIINSNSIRIGDDGAVEKGNETERLIGGKKSKAKSNKRLQKNRSRKTTFKHKNVV